MSETTASKDRMIAAAASLFARSGFNGVTTRDIAQSASVSEGNIFRYFPSKRELFIAAIDHELGKLQSRVELLTLRTDVDDSRLALRSLFEMITETVVSQPELVRLLHFSALEFGSDLEPVYRRHLDGLIAASAKNFEQWSRDSGFRDLSARVTVLSFVATVVLLQNYRLFSGADLPFSSVEGAAAAYAELWYRVLCDKPVDKTEPPDVGSAKQLGNLDQARL
jgi:AcrR family transcriptional regulator